MLRITDGNGNLINNQAGKKWVKDGGCIIGDVNSLSSYNYKIITTSNMRKLYLVEDDLYNGKNPEMSMNEECFKKYFLPIE
jgi:hypothetical protein